MTTEVVVYQQLKHLGVPASLKGYRYLQEAVKYAVENPSINGQMTKQLYPTIASTCNTTTSRVERAIRHAIEYVYLNTDSDVLAQYFGNTINATSGKLTNTQFIAGIAEYIRMEVIV